MHIPNRIILLRSLNPTRTFVGSRPGINVVPALFATFLLSLFAHNSAATTFVGVVFGTQEVFGDYEYLPPRSFDIVKQDIDYSSSTLTGASYQPNIRGTRTADIEFTTNADSNPGDDGSLRTKTELKLKVNNATINPEVLTSLDLLVSQSVNWIDNVTTNHPFAEIFEFQTTITGNLNHSITFPKGGFLQSGSYKNFVVAAGGTDATGGPVQTQRLDSFGGGFNPPPVNASQPLSMVLQHNKVLYAGVPETFRFSVIDSIHLVLENIDAEQLEIEFSNDLSNTITTYANVYDGNGNLLPDARVISSLGFEYAPIPGTTQSSVPLPSPMALLVAGMLLANGRMRKFAPQSRKQAARRPITQTG